jgi:cytochrome c oxidase subunit 4
MSDTATATDTKTTSDHGGEHGADHVGHVTSIKLLVNVLAALLVLTVVTVAVSYVDLGPLNLAVAMLIACVKASLVVLFFMHLLWDKPFNAVLFLSTLLFLALFIGFCVLDTREYAPDVIRDYGATDNKFVPGGMPQFEYEKPNAGK